MPYQDQQVKGRRRSAWLLFAVCQSRIKSLGLEERMRDSAPSFLTFPHSDSCCLRSPDFPFHREIPPPLVFLLFLFLTCLIQPCTESWCYACSPVLLARSFPFKWLSGWSQPFHHPPDPLPLVRKELMLGTAACGMCTCPQLMRPPHIGHLKAAKKKLPSWTETHGGVRNSPIT